MVSVDAPRGTLQADAVLISVAGSSSIVASMAGIELPLESLCVQAFVSEPVKPVLDCVVNFNQGLAYVSQSDKGEMLLGGETDRYNSYAQRGGFARIEDVVSRAITMFPYLSRMRLMRYWAGTADISMDGKAIIGKTPALQLYSQARGRLRFHRDIRAFLPGGIDHAVQVAGGAAGSFGLEHCLRTGHRCGERAAAAAGFAAPPTGHLPEVDSARVLCGALPPTVAIDNPRGRHGKPFVDFQTDTTVADLHLAIREGFADVEHAKRYTTTGMGTDQGKTSNLNAIAVIAEASGVPEQDIGHTTMRPPYVPVTFGAIAGEDIGVKLAPTRRSPVHECHEASGAVFMTSGVWIYPRYFPRDGEAMPACVAREAHNVHENVGVIDMSTLGKIDVQGRDALEFLERVYCNDLSGIAVGRIRYSVMLREDGIVREDGTVTRLARQHFLVTTTTANAWRVWLHLEKLRQVHWPALDVKMASVTDHWASLAIAGPHARDLLCLLDPGFGPDNASFPFMCVKQGTVMGVEARVFRISYSGELGFEINVPAGFAPALWRAVLDKGRPFNIAPYGLETLDVMRIEKGFLAAGTEIDGCATPGDLGLSRMVSNRKDFIGCCLLQRPALHDPARWQLTGLVPVDGISSVPEGAQITFVAGAARSAAVDRARDGGNPRCTHR